MRTAIVFPATTTIPIPSAVTLDLLQLQLREMPLLEPIAAGEPSEAPIHKLWKCARAHKPSVQSLQPGKALKRAKKGGEKKLNASSLSTTFTSVQTSRTKV
ncbi:hypothetical protein B0H14DRAFT_2586866 [Mycena olivaceomarginata]|nr:hypothetical protein B0H14DRAFT_2586866 [Mycena olivaceomarginata]